MRKNFVTSRLAKRFFLYVAIILLVNRNLLLFLYVFFIWSQSISQTIVFRAKNRHFYFTTYFHLISVTWNCVVIHKKTLRVQIWAMMINIDTVNVVLCRNLSLIKIYRTLWRFSLLFYFGLDLDLLLNNIFIYLFLY